MMKKDIVGSVHIELNLDRIAGNLDKAQAALNQQIVADSTPYIPFRQGTLRSQVRYPDGMSGGSIEWYAPYAGWWSPPVKYPTGRKLQYHEPGTGAKWFETAKTEHLHDWEELVKRKLVE